VICQPRHHSAKRTHDSHSYYKNMELLGVQCLCNDFDRLIESTISRVVLFIIDFSVFLFPNDFCIKNDYCLPWIIATISFY